ncbi:MAG TPA: carboxypeptidase regulatory-like domain-containing protein [Candidatus Limnocylindrales bacterium]|nr:carboxypeptidase regulatory-like domain-containing protein [Candidatus Limnocylindrales bacterium]
MKFKIVEKISRAMLGFICVLALGVSAAAQSDTGTIHGQVKDPSGAAVVGATVLVTSSSGETLTATTNHDGFYEVKNLAAGTYKVQALATGFAMFENDAVQVAQGQTAKLDIPLAIEVQQQKVVVNSQAATVDVAPENNASSVVISGKELDALSDDPDELQNDLQALAGPSAGPNGGQMYIDGFTAGQLPPKSSIREIRINQNPFSSEYDKLGYGRIEIFTKPGTDQWHGQGDMTGNDSGLNTKNPFLGDEEEPPYYSTMYSGSLGGPLSKKASMFVSAQRRNINDIQAVDAFPFDPTTQAFSEFQQAIPDSMTRTNISPRVDYQLGKNDTFTGRYQYWRNNEENQGIGAFTLASQAFNELETEQTVQAGDTHVFGASVVNETRFQFVHDVTNQMPQSTLPTVNVEGFFDGGGNSQGQVLDDENRYEFQNYTSVVHGAHMIKFGARLRETTDANNSMSQFNSTYIFKTSAAYQTTINNIAANMSPTANGGGAYEYTVTTGIPNASVSLFDAGLYIEDDWRVRPNITLSGGLRFETQTDVPDHADWAPRVALAWGLARGKNPAKTVIRAGWGMFYDRFQDQYLIQAEHLNGIAQTSYVVYSPTFFDPTAPVTSLPAGSALSTVYRVAPNLRAPQTMQAAVSVERQINKVTNLAVTYMNSRGIHQFFTNNVNAPEPGTFPDDPIYPTGVPGNIFQYESEGIFKQNQLIVNMNVRAGAKLMLFGYYTLNYASSDAAGANTFPSNPYNVLADYGRSAFDTRNRVFFGGTVGLPYGFRLSPFMIASSGSPYNVVLSQDFVGSTVLNQRPALATNPTNPNLVVNTPLGNFDTNLSDLGAGETIIPVNGFTGPPHFSLNLRLSKVFGFGKVSEGPNGGGGGGDGHYHGRGPGGPFGGGGGPMMGAGGSNHRYNLTLSVQARNITNYLNLAQPNGTLPVPDLSLCTPNNSCSMAPPLFGESNSLARGPFSSNGAPRLFYLQASFAF